MELTKNQETVKVLPDYPVLFSSKDSKRAQILAAAARLGMTLRQPLEASELIPYADRLQRFPVEALERAFIQAELTFEAWPTPAKIANLIFDRMFADDLDMLLMGIKKHEWEWKELKAWTGSEDGIYHPTEYPPIITQGLANALMRFSRGSTWKKGLKRLSEHPAVNGWPSVDGSEEAERTASRLEKEFRAAWDRSQSEEL